MVKTFLKNVFLFSIVVFLITACSETGQNPDYDQTFQFSVDFDSTQCKVTLLSSEKSQQLEPQKEYELPAYEIVNFEVDPKTGYYFHSWEGISWDNTGKTEIVIDQDYQIEVAMQELPEKGNLLMLYFATDNNLSDTAAWDIRRMEQDYYALTPEQRAGLTVLVLFDMASGPTKLFELGPYNYGYGDTVNSPELNGWFEAGDDLETDTPETLEHFLKYAYENYNDYTSRTLILSGHGNGYNGISARAIAYDNESSYPDMSIEDFQSALNNAGVSKTNLDIIGYSMCRSGGFEVYYELRDLTSYFIASPNIQYGFWTGRDFLLPFVENTLPADIAVEVAQTSENRSKYITNPNALSVVATAGAEECKDAVDALAVELSSYAVSEVESYFTQAAQSEDVAKWSYNLGLICENLIDDGIAADQAQNVLDLYEPNVLYAWNSADGKSYSGPHLNDALTISFPEPDNEDGEDIKEIYRQIENDLNCPDLDFSAVDSDGVVEGWVEMLNYFYSDTYEY